MSRIDDVINALADGRAIFEEIMGMKGGSIFEASEVYACGLDSPELKELFERGAAFELNGTIAAGDNLEYMEYLLKERDMAGKIQLIYVDPPFFSNAKYLASVRLESEKLGKSPVIKTGAYDDTWEGNLKQYLTMLTIRFLMMKELLADSGFIWVHLDWHGSHYVKLLLDEIFGYDNFINEVIWTYKSGGASKKSFARKHDTLLMYSKTKKYKFNRLKEKSYNRGFKPYRFKGVKEYEDEIGWYTVVNMKDVWEIDMVGRTSAERTGYATQKPEKLLERIIESCTDEGDICADFFAGSGTLGATAAKMGRRWMLCDEGDVAISSQIERIAKIGEADETDICFEVVRTVKAGQETFPGLVRISEEMGVLRIKDYVPDRIKLSEADEEIALEYLQKDSCSCIAFWSIDLNYDGETHRAHEIIKGTDFLPYAGSAFHLVGYDYFGNRFEFEK